MFIAHDAPLQGSNAAIGPQHFSRHMLNFYIDTPVAYFLGEHAIPAVIDIAQLGSNIINLFGANTTVNEFVSPVDQLSILDTPAALQMNYYWVDIFEDVSTVPHSNWQQEFETMGYPQASRNVAISNGNECAVNHGFSPGNVLVEIDDLDNPDFFGDIVHMLGTFIGGALNGRVDLALLGVFPGSSKWYYKFDMHATPSDGGRVYYGRVSYEKKLLWVVKTKIQVTQRSIDAPNWVLPYDSFSGGFYDINDILDDLPSQLPPLILHHQSFGFIPVVSALDIQRDNAPEPIYSDYQKSYAGGNVPHSNLSTPLDNFVVDFEPNQFRNNEHISFQQRNGDWLAGELNGGSNIIFPDCSYICNGVRISGSNSVCMGTSEVYTINNLPAGANAVFSWSISPAGGFTLTTNGNSVTVTPNGNISGEATLMVSVDTDCGTVNAEKIIHAGAQRPIIYDSNGNEVASFNFPLYTWESITFTTPPGTLEWSWTKVSGNFTLMANNTNYAQVYASQNTSGIVEVRIRDDCGWGPVTFLSLNFGSGGGGFGFRTTSGSSSPNISLEIIEGDTKSNTSKKAKTSSSVANERTKGTYAIMVADMYGATIYKAQRIKQKNVNIKKNKWPKGIYFVRVSNNKGEVQTKGVALN